MTTMMMIMMSSITYSKEEILHKDGIESPNASIQEHEEGEKERHVLYAFSCHHRFLHIVINIY
jgi:hypothetical protein